MRLWLVLVLFTLILPAAAQEAQLTDQEVLLSLNAGREPDQRLRPEQVRILRPAELPGVTLVGYSKGRGYLIGTVFLGTQPYRPEDAARHWLAGAGWAGAAAPARLELARRWVQEAMLAFGETMLVENPGRPFGGRNPEFTGVLERTAEDGAVLLVAWIREDPGLLPGDTYRRSLFCFGPDGTLVRVRMLDRFYESLP